MKNCLWLASAFVIVVGFSATQLQARGGGGHGGGGHHGGGHHGEHHHADHNHGDHHHDHHHHAHYGGHHHPFTPGWYGNHPNAWNHGNGNWWAASSFGAAAGWMGMSALNPTAYAYPAAVPTVLTGDGGSDQANPPAPPVSAAALAAKLAQNGATEPGGTAEFLPLGVYSLAPENQTEASIMVQLAVSKEGVLRGSYYDLVGDQEKTIHGAVDKQTQQVAWTVGSEGKVVFETALASLTDKTGPLSVHFENGQSSRWTIARFEDSPADEASDSESEPESENS